MAKKYSSTLWIFVFWAFLVKLPIGIVDVVLFIFCQNLSKCLIISLAAKGLY